MVKTSNQTTAALIAYSCVSETKIAEGRAVSDSGRAAIRFWRIAPAGRRVERAAVRALQKDAKRFASARFL